MEELAPTECTDWTVDLPPLPENWKWMTDADVPVAGYWPFYCEYEVWIDNNRLMLDMGDECEGEVPFSVIDALKSVTERGR